MTILIAASVQPTSLSAAEPAPIEAAASQVVRDTSAYARRQGWFSRDKALHFGISAAASGGVYAAARELGLGRWPSVVTSAVLVGAAGVLREVLDPQDQVNHVSRRFLSKRDLVWNTVGIAVGISVADRFFGARAAEPESLRGAPPGPAPVPWRTDGGDRRASTRTP